MRIGIDCRLWDETGIGRYIRNIVENLAKTDKKNEYMLFVLKKDFEKINLPSNFTKVEADIRWYTFSEQLIFPIKLYKEKLDLLFVPNLNVPILYLKKFIVTIHDLTVIRIKTGRASTLPYPVYLVKRLAVRLPLWFAAKRAKAIFAVSEYVKKDIENTFKVSKNKISITPCSVSPEFKKENDEKVLQVLERYNVKIPYLFYVGNAHPHKNLDGLLKSFELINQDFSNLTLVLGGRKKFFYERLEKEWQKSKISEKIKFVGFIDDDDLSSFYSGAEAFVNPSFHEGFGIQILEAFACGTKVACSKTGSLPEIGGNIAYYFNPKDIKNMAQTIISCIGDKNEKRIKAGYDRIQNYSWENSAKVISDKIYEIGNNI